MTTTTLLIEKGRRAIEAREATNSESNWSLGEVAAEWDTLGETATALATELRCDRTLIAAARRVWEQFADQRPRWPTLSWSHFNVARHSIDPPALLTAAAADALSVLDLRRQLHSGQSAPTSEQLTRRVSAAINHWRTSWPRENFPALAELLATAELQIRREIEAAIAPPPPS